MFNSMMLFSAMCEEATKPFLRVLFQFSHLTRETSNDVNFLLIGRRLSRIGENCVRQLLDHDLMAPSRIDASNDDLQFPITIIISPLTFLFLLPSTSIIKFESNIHTHTHTQAQLPQTIHAFFKRGRPWRAMTQVLMLKIIFW